MSEDEEFIQSINQACQYNIGNPGYYMYEKREFGKIVGMKITGAIWSRWEAFICLKGQRGERYVLYVYHNSDTGEPDFRIFDSSTGALCFKLPACWSVTDFRRYMSFVDKEIQEHEERVKEATKA